MLLFKEGPATAAPPSLASVLPFTPATLPDVLGVPDVRDVRTRLTWPARPAWPAGAAWVSRLWHARKARRRGSPLPVRVKVYAGAVPAVALLTLYAWQQAGGLDAPGTSGVRDSYWTLPMIFAGITALSVLFPIKLTRSYKFTMASAAHFASLLLFGPVVAMLMAGLGEGVGNLTLLAAGKRDPWNVLFNTGKSMLAVAAAGVVSTALMTTDIADTIDPGNLLPILGLVATAAVLHLVNTFPTAIAVGLQHGSNPVQVWIKARRADGLQSVALYLVGLLAALTVHDRPWTIVVMVMPMAPIYITLQRTVQFLEQKLDEQTVAAVEAMADTVDMRDHYTFEHSRRVARYAVQLAEQLGLPAKQVETIRLAARVHDLGKIGVPDHILRKPGPLTAEEWVLMERHVQTGYDILSRFADYRECKELVLLHHERYDGSGYPQGSPGSDAIEDPQRRKHLLGAQIIAVADALDAMTSDRPYRQALALDVALAEFRRLRGGQWMPQVVDALEALVADPRQNHALARTRLSLVPVPATATA